MIKNLSRPTIQRAQRVATLHLHAMLSTDRMVAAKSADREHQPMANANLAAQQEEKTARTHHLNCVQ